MDSQGFTVNGQTLNGAVKNAAGAVQPGAAGLIPVNRTRIALNDVVSVAHASNRPDSADARIEKLHKFQGATDKVFMGELFGMFGGMIFGGAAALFNKSQAVTVIKSVFVAPFDALRHTKLNNIAALPAEYMRAVSQIADTAALEGAQKALRKKFKNTHTSDEINEIIAKTNFDTFDYSSVRGTGSKKWVAGAADKASALENSGREIAKSVNEAIAPVTQPVHTAVRNGVDSFGSSDIGKKITTRIERIVDSRIERKTASFTKHMDKAHNALTMQTPGFFDRAVNFVTGKKPANLGTHPALSEVTTHLTNARGATSTAERVLHTDAAANALKKLSGTADKTLKGRVLALGEAIGHGNSSATILQGLETSKGAGLSSTVKALGKAAGRIPLFGAILGVGAVAGISASLMTHKRDNRIAKISHEEIVEAIGANNPLMKSIDQAYSSEAYKRVAKTGLSIVGDIGNAAMGSMEGGGGMAMMGVVMLPMAGSALIKENALLNAYANLRQEEKTGKPLASEDKLELVRQLVAGVPSVAAHGGYYNRLTSPVAEAIADKKLNAIETMKLLADDQQFTALASEVQQKQKELVTGQNTQAIAPETVANDNHVSVAPQVPMPHLEAATAVSTNGIQHEGRIEALQKTTGI